MSTRGGKTGSSDTRRGLVPFACLGVYGMFPNSHLCANRDFYILNCFIVGLRDILCAFMFLLLFEC